MKEREHVLKILNETKEAFEKGDAIKLKDLSNQTIHASSIDQDPGNVAVAVIVYSLSKIAERKNYQKYSGCDEFCRTIIKLLDKTASALAKSDDTKARSYLTLMRKSIGKLSGKLKGYIQDVFRKAEINKASRIYEHGVSMERTASLLGVTMFDLAEYAGKTGIPDVPLAKTQGVRARLKVAEEMFG